MKKFAGICTVFLMGLLCTGCAASKTMSEEGKAETLPSGFEEIAESIEEKSTEEKASGIQVFKTEEVEVIPKIIEYDYEGACGLGEVLQMRGILPGAGEGIWHIIEIEGVEYFYGTYNDFPDKTELFEYAIVGEEYSLKNGISVGMTKSELLACYPNMRIVDTEGKAIDGMTDWIWWNNTAYPRSPKGMDEEWNYGGEEYYYWDSQFDYIIIADIEQEPDALPLSVALMMKEDIVRAITFYNPTAN